VGEGEGAPPEGGGQGATPPAIHQLTMSMVAQQLSRPYCCDSSLVTMFNLRPVLQLAAVARTTALPYPPPVRCVYIPQ